MTLIIYQETNKQANKQASKQNKKQTNKQKNKHPPPPLVKRVNWGYLYTPIQTGTFECGYTPAYWGYTKYECDYTPITWGYPNIPSIGNMLLNAFIWHFWSHAGNAQMGHPQLAVCPRFPWQKQMCVPDLHVLQTHTPPTPPHTFNGSRLAKMKKYISHMSLP